jgi:hypothetical protein
MLASTSAAAPLFLESTPSVDDYDSEAERLSIEAATKLQTQVRLMSDRLHEAKKRYSRGTVPTDFHNALVAAVKELVSVFPCCQCFRIINESFCSARI